MRHCLDKKNWAIACYSAIALVISLSTLYFIALCYSMGPFRDMWIAMDFIRAYFENSVSVSDFFALHGGAHRLALPRILFLLEYGLFSGKNIFLIFVAVSIQFSVVCLIWRLVRQELYMSRQYQIFLTAMTAILMFNATQLENFVYNFDIQWFMTTAAAAWGFVAWIKVLSTYAEHKKIASVSLLLALLATGASMFSSFSGLCVWLVLPFLMLGYRFNKKHIAIASMVIMLIVIAYLQDLSVGGNASSLVSEPLSFYITFLFSLLLRWLKWIALYFGSPLGRDYFWLGTLFSYSSLLFLAWSWVKVFRNGAQSFTSFQIFCLSIALFAAFVGMATGLGRMYFVNTADEDRYQSIVAIYWLGVYGLLLSQSLRNSSENNKLKRAMVVVILFWTCLVLPHFSIRDARAQINFFDRVNSVNLAIATGQWEYSEIKDTLILGDKTKKENRPEEHADFLLEKGWGVFASNESALLGQVLDLTRISADACEGDIYSIHPVNLPYHGYRFTGNGVDVINETLLRDYVAINDAGQVIGLGHLEREKDSFLPVTWQSTEKSQWLLYTLDMPEPMSLKILGQREGGDYCVVASTRLFNRLNVLKEPH